MESLEQPLDWEPLPAERGWGDWEPERRDKAVAPAGSYEGVGDGNPYCT